MCHKHGCMMHAKHSQVMQEALTSHASVGQGSHTPLLHGRWESAVLEVYIGLTMLVGDP